MRRHRGRTFRPTFDLLNDRRLLAALTPSQVTGAYGLNAIAFNANGTAIKGDGSGQTIALVDAYHDPYLTSDVATFSASYRLPVANVVQVNLAGGATSSG